MFPAARELRRVASRRITAEAVAGAAGHQRLPRSDEDGGSA
jgi:hypothetical protein